MSPDLEQRIISMRYQPTTVGNMMVDPEGGYASVEAVEILQRQLAEREKQNVMLREAIIRSIERMCFAEPWSAAESDIEFAKKALATTDDLSGYILCDAEPRSYLYRHNSAFGDGFIWSHRPLHNGQDALESLPLYKARKP